MYLISISTAILEVYISFYFCICIIPYIPILFHLIFIVTYQFYYFFNIRWSQIFSHWNTGNKQNSIYLICTCFVVLISSLPSKSSNFNSQHKILYSFCSKTYIVLLVFFFNLKCFVTCLSLTIHVFRVF